jgi:hypothetical protein
MINHGVRRLAQNEATPEIFFKNPNFNLDLWSYSQEVTNQISLLLGAGQDQFFGPSGNYPVKEWCLFGRGLGAIGCMISAIQGEYFMIKIVSTSK